MGLLKHPVNERRFSVVYVGDDCNIPDIHIKTRSRGIFLVGRTTVLYYNFILL